MKFHSSRKLNIESIVGGPAIVTEDHHYATYVYLKSNLITIASLAMAG